MHFLLLTLLSCIGVEGFWLPRIKTLCYDNLGCFSNDSPFDNANRKLPQSPEVIQTRFLLYTRTNPTVSQLLDPYDASSVTGSNFNGGRKTVFIVHGYSDDGENAWIEAMTEELLDKGDMNVIAVDWSKGADIPNYYQAAANARVVGVLIGKMMNQLQSSAGATYSNMHIVGHSLGSHIAGYAGDATPGLGRITGLDPAGPCFEKKNETVRLDPSDASFVDVIHTNGKPLLQGGFGCEKPLGHADFYPNGGEDQTGCPKPSSADLFLAITTLNFKDVLDKVSCSHLRVLDLFTESIKSECQFTAYPCASKEDYGNDRCTECGSGCNHMGYNSNDDVHGTFYLSTTDSVPFC